MSEVEVAVVVPVPVKVMVCAVPAVPVELSVTVIVAVAAPIALGVNVTAILQLCPGCKVVVEVQSVPPLSTCENADVELNARPESCSTPAPTFETIAV